MKKAIQVTAAILAITALDLITKHIASANISPMEPVTILPFFNLVNVHNKGAAFGLFDTFGNGFFIAVSLAAIVFIVYLLARTDEPYIPLAMILAGALGNLVDRLTLGYVRDFLDLHAGGWHWPAFNVADSALTIGLILILAYPLFQKGGPKKKTGPGETPHEAGPV
jgi:signal peptidase II